MRSLSMLLVSGAAFTLWVVGCGSDSDTGNQGLAGAPGGSVTQCLGAYADLDQTAYDAQVTSGLGCSSDSESICRNDVTDLVGTCGKTCYLNVAHDDKSQADCVGPCIQQAVTVPKALSDSCIDCYVADVACARDKCLNDCGFTPGSAACIQCRADNGCARTFYDCSGIPVPAGVELGDGSAGASGSGS